MTQQPSITPAALRTALDAAGYPDASIVGSTVHIRDKGGLFYREHREALQAAGIPVAFGGVDIPGWYFFAVRLQAEPRRGETP